MVPMAPRPRLGRLRYVRWTSTRAVGAILTVAEAACRRAGPAPLSITSTPCRRDRHRLAVRAVTGVVTVASLTATGPRSAAASRGPGRAATTAGQDAAEARPQQARDRYAAAAGPPSPPSASARPVPGSPPGTCSRAPATSSAAAPSSSPPSDGVPAPAAPAPAARALRLPPRRPRSRRLHRRAGRDHARSRHLPCPRGHVFVACATRRARPRPASGRARSSPTSTRPAAGSAPTPTSPGSTPRPGRGSRSTRCSSRREAAVAAARQTEGLVDPLLGPAPRPARLRPGLRAARRVAGSLRRLPPAPHRRLAAIGLDLRRLRIPPAPPSTSAPRARPGPPTWCRRRRAAAARQRGGQRRRRPAGRGPGRTAVAGRASPSAPAAAPRRWWPGRRGRPRDLVDPGAALDPGGARRHHLLDPRTGLPAEGAWRTVTAVGATASPPTRPPQPRSCSARAPPAGSRARRRGPAGRRDGACRTVGGWPTTPREGVAA